MQTGLKISALAHGLLLAWAFLGGVFTSDPLPIEVQDVTVISAEEFDRMTGGREAPEVTAALSEPAEAPAPEVAAEPETPPEPAPEPAPEPKPEPKPESVPAPQPDPMPTPPAPDTATVVPEPPALPQRSSERIAPEPVAPPPPEAKSNPVAREEVVADSAAETLREEQEATAPEEAAQEIVTEAEETAALAPTRSPRPATRPERRPDPTPEPAPAPAAETPKPARSEDAVAAAAAAAVAEAMSGARQQAPAAPSGPPLTAGETEALRVAVSSCWNVGSLSSEALATTVVVAVSLTQDGKPQADTIRMVSHSGGGEGAAKQAFEAARRAIIRCGAKGFNLPAAKYDRWRDIEMTFNPERMRIK